MKFKATSLLFLILSFSYFSGIALAAEMITDVGGNWVGVVTLENGQELPYDITISQEGTTASGFLAGIGGPDITITDVRLEENILYYSSTRPIGGAEVPFDYIAVISGDYMNITIIRVGATGPNSVLSTLTRRQ
ncbi:MAG: hypothetical protein P8J61_01170 [Gammaproteobacteria bacterium]|jgi:hypothetical protein|nr:hypothetical protein [Gammaproteobacteria bacterium]